METIPACSVSFDDDAGNGDWAAAANWSTDAVPGAGDDVCIPSGFPIVSVSTAVPAVRGLDAPATSLAISGTLTVSSGGARVGGLDISGGTASFGGPLAANSVNLRGGTLGGAGTMTIRFLEWSGGALAGNAATVVGDGALRLRGPATKQLVDRTLRMAAASELSGAGALQLAGDARVEVESRLTLQGDATIAGASGTLRVLPGGTLAKTASGTATLGLPVDNDGTLEVAAGVLRLSGGSGSETSAGAYTVADGSALEWAAGSFALFAPRATGPGPLRVAGASVSTSGAGSLASVALDAGSLTADGTLSANTVTLTGGSFGGAGAVAIDRLVWSGGTLAGTGTATVGAGGLALSGDATKVLADRTLALAGDSVLGGAGDLRLDGAARLENAARLEIVAGLTVSSTGGLLANRPGGAVSSAGTATLAVPVDNDGVLEAVTGTLRLTAGSGLGEVSAGAYLIAGGARIEWGAGAYALDAPSATGAGTALVNGASVTATGSASFAALTVNGGGAHFSGSLSAGAVSLGGGTLSGAGAMTIGRLDWSGGVLAGSGTATVGAGGLALAGDTAKSLRDRTLVLAGDSVLSGTGPLQLSGTARLRNRALLDVRSDLTLTGSGTASGLDNEAPGTLRKSSGSGTATLALPLSNAGVVDARAGRLRISALANYDAAAKTLTGGTYDVSSTLSVPDLDVVRNAATIRLREAGRLEGALERLAENAGVLELSGGASLATAGALVNSGSVRLADATLTVAGAYTQTSGVTRLEDGMLDAGGLVDLAGGVLEGTGSVRTGLRNAAVVAPLSTLRVIGDYAQTPAGVLRTTIGAAGHGRLEVTGAATLDGVLEVSSAGFEPPDAARFELLAARSVAGRWASPSLGTAFDADYGPSSMSVVARRDAIPTPVPTVAPTPTVAPVPDRDVVPSDILPPPAPPVAGRQTTATLSGGEVLVKLPGAPAGFVGLKGAAGLPDGTTVDARQGSVTLVAAARYGGRSSATTTVTVQSAIFQIRQIRARDRRTAVTDLVLKTPAGAARRCVGRAPRKGLVVRKVSATAKGLVRTIGGASVLTTRNATWRMDDRCDGTRTRIRKGRASAFNRITGRTTRLRDRQLHVARARLFAARKLQLRTAPRP